MTHSAATGTAAPGAGSTVQRALRVVATLSAASIVGQGVSAGLILSRAAAGDALHFGGAVVVHVLTGLTALLVYLAVRRGRGPWWPVVLAAVVFVVGFVQAAVGEAGLFAVHVPLAMLLLAGAVTVTVWALSRRAT